MIKIKHIIFILLHDIYLFFNKIFKKLIDYSEQFTTKRNDLINIVEDIDVNLTNITSFNNVNNEKNKEIFTKIYYSNN